MNKQLRHKLYRTIRKYGAFGKDLAEHLLEQLDSGVDELIQRLVEKDHIANAKFGKEYPFLSKRNRGFNLTGKSITSEEGRYGVLIDGGSGSGKSSVAIVRSILTVLGSQIVHDPSGELSGMTAGSLHDKGTKVVLLNWLDANQSHGFNPLHRCRSISDYSKLATTLMEGKSGKNDNAFFSNMAIKILVLAIRIIKQLPTEYQNLNCVAQLIERLSHEQCSEQLDKLVAIVSENDEGLFEAYSSIVSMSSDTRSSVLATASTAVSMFLLDENIARITSSDTLGAFEDFRKERTALFLSSSTVNMSYYSPITNVFLQQYTESFFESLPKDGELDMYFHLDEAPILNVPLDVWACNVRKYKGNLFVVGQDSRAQFTDRYGSQKTQAILSNLKTKLYLSPSVTTAKELERELGDYQYKDKKTEQMRTRPLMKAHEILQMSKNIGLITRFGEKPIKAKLTPYYKIPSLAMETQKPIPKGMFENELPTPPHLDLEVLNARILKEQFEPLKTEEDA